MHWIEIKDVGGNPLWINLDHAYLAKFSPLERFLTIEFDGQSAVAVIDAPDQIAKVTKELRRLS